MRLPILGRNPGRKTLSFGVAAVLLAGGAAAALVNGGGAATAAGTPVAILSNGFEDGTTQNWAGRSDVEVVANSTAQARTGTHSLLTSGRTSSWRGPTLSILDTVAKGTSYTFDVWVRLGANAGTQQARLSVESRVGGTPTYSTVVGNTNVNDYGWTELKATYILGSDVDFLTVYVETASTLSDVYIDDFSISSIPTLPVQTDIPSLKDVFAADWTVGAAVAPAQLTGDRGTLLAKHFNQVTPGNAMKWDATERTENTFDYTDADKIVAFAQANNQKVYGHTLVWHNQTPAWVFQDSSGAALAVNATSKALVLSRLENHIRNVAGHFKGKVVAWDVANEVIDPGQSDGNRRSNWYTYTGLDYLRTAFTVAHEVDPNAQLCINDYSTTDSTKLNFYYNLTAQLIGEGLPVQCVGHQMHNNIDYPTQSDTDNALTKFEALPVKQRITELDVSIYNNSNDSYTSISSEVIAKQEARYRVLFAAFLKHAASIDSLTFWGLTDEDSWLQTWPKTRLEAPLLFDNQLQKKSVFDVVVASKSGGTTTTTSTTRPTTTTTTTRPTTTTTRPTTTTTRPTTTTTRPTTTTTRPTTTTTRSTTTTTRPTTSTSTTTTTGGGTGGCSATFTPNSWPGAFVGNVTVSASSAISAWKVTLNLPSGVTITNVWSGTRSGDTGIVTVSNVSYNGTVSPSQSQTFGFQANGSPTGLTLSCTPA
jgi:endo-1,4-beta-xylanase